MIQDIAPYVLKNEYHPVRPAKNSVLLCYEKDHVLLKKSAVEIVFPTFEEAEQILDTVDDIQCLYEQSVYLFSIDDVRFYLGKDEVGNRLQCSSCVWEKHGILRGAQPKHLAFAGLLGWQLYRWYASRQYCGRCGMKMEPDEKERMMRCPKCGIEEYPKICPAVIVGVIKGDQILMTKYARGNYHRYALLAGFTEFGETVEETVSREVMEEVGLHVKNITYYKSQPWPLSDTLLMGFFCELDGEDEIVLDKEELALAEWFAREDIAVEPDDFSLTNEMMIAFRDGYQITHV